MFLVVRTRVAEAGGRNSAASPFDCEENDEELQPEESEDEATECLPTSMSAAAAASVAVTSSSSTSSSASMSSQRPQRQHALQAADCLRALRAFNNLSEDEKDAFEEWVDENASVSASDVTESKPYASLRLPCTASTPAPSVAAALPNEPESATKAFFQVH